ncbi:MAG TPA: hypothetical protein VLZ11_03885 [Flavobacterium sp.]|nr:hypothetical protein [Flavobacterium sp.]
MKIGILLTLIGIILLWKGKFWEHDYKTDYRVPDKLRFFFAGVVAIILGILFIIDNID